MSWVRTTPLDAALTDRHMEEWLWSEDDPARPFRRLACPMDITIGKKLDVRALKATSLAEIREYAKFLRQTAAQLYAEGAERRVLAHCPCCDAVNDRLAVAIRVFDVPYLQCPRCGHGFVQEQPTRSTLAALFAESEQHAAPYIDPDHVAARMAQVIAPKIAWTLSIYQRHYGRPLGRAVDVGAGGGHFVGGLRQMGIAAAGFETSRAARSFARQAFGIELDGGDFAASEGGEADLITFWGLLEYVPEPRRFLEAARQRLIPDSGLLVVEVPRLNCLGTAIQKVQHDTVARHMDPTSHVNTFTDASLATALLETGFRPVAAWYFGMDIYELLIQCALRLDDDRMFDRLADLIPVLQANLDHGRQCDDLVMAAVPMP